MNRKSASIAVIELGIIKRGRLGDKIPLAFLPISVFYDYFVPNAERGMSSKARAEAAAHLAMFNWKQRERELEYSEEPFLVDHKYFSVSYKAV